jgi:hypothetical protein
MLPRLSVTACCALSPEQAIRIEMTLNNLIYFVA